MVDLYSLIACIRSTVFLCRTHTVCVVSRDVIAHTRAIRWQWHARSLQTYALAHCTRFTGITNGCIRFFFKFIKLSSCCSAPHHCEPRNTHVHLMRNVQYKFVWLLQVPLQCRNEIKWNEIRAQIFNKLQAMTIKSDRTTHKSRLLWEKWKWFSCNPIRTKSACNDQVKVTNCRKINPNEYVRI